MEVGFGGDGVMGTCLFTRGGVLGTCLFTRGGLVSVTWCNIVSRGGGEIGVVWLGGTEVTQIFRCGGRSDFFFFF